MDVSVSDAVPNIKKMYQINMTRLSHNKALQIDSFRFQGKSK